MKKSIYAIILVVILFLFFGLTTTGILEDTSQSAPEDKVTFFGTDIREYSLFAAAIIIGLLDGFNPCAMWVLIYLITLVSQLQDRRKMWMIAGTFILASGVIYFLILTLWLNGWNYLNLLVSADWILKAAAIFALATGGYFIYEFYKSGGKLECDIGDLKKRKKTMTKIQNIVHSKFTLPTLLALVALAFAINLTEFVCSIGLPALFTQILSVADVSIISKYFYILLYVLAFMADDLIVFSLGLMAIESDVLQKYNGAVKLIGGILMIALGIILLFFPGFLI